VEDKDLYINMKLAIFILGYSYFFAYLALARPVAQPRLADIKPMVDRLVHQVTNSANAARLGSNNPAALSAAAARKQENNLLMAEQEKLRAALRNGALSREQRQATSAEINRMSDRLVADSRFISRLEGQQKDTFAAKRNTI
jgi:hypothetical protein